MNILHSFLPKYVSGYAYKYHYIFNETLGFRDWNEDYNSFFISQELLDVYQWKLILICLINTY
jgi:hypothetical protein